MIAWNLYTEWMQIRQVSVGIKWNTDNTDAGNRGLNGFTQEFARPKYVINTTKEEPHN
jgi:hypothetical protein